MAESFDPQHLLELAWQARDRSYAPYSRFRVGAAIQTASGRVFTGCNVENVSYGLTVCAERVAVLSAVAAGERELTAAAVVTGVDLSQIPGTPPCGACRQVLFEFGPEMKLVLPSSTRESPLIISLRELLPRGFGPQDLAKGVDP